MFGTRPSMVEEQVPGMMWMQLDARACGVLEANISARLEPGGKDMRKRTSLVHRREGRRGRDDPGHQALVCDPRY
jgi:hypothetical protein